MKIDIEAYNEHYHQAGKFIDNYQEGIKLLPFNSNTSSAYDKNCGLHGITGEFFRLLENDGTKAIDNFELSAVEPVSRYLSEQKQMDSTQLNEFICMMKDVLMVNGSLNITDSSFLKYLPLLPDDNNIGANDRKRYSDGQRKIGNYLYSMISEGMQSSEYKSVSNLFSRILKEALTGFSGKNEGVKKREYFVLPFIKQSFEADLKWMLDQEETVKVKYLPLFLYFYVCYSIAQTIVLMDAKKQDKVSNPVSFYFMLNSEKASLNHDAVISGWSYRIPRSSLDKLYGKSQAIDILNSVLGGNIGLYAEIMEKLEETNFVENRDVCNELLRKFQEDKHAMFNRRTSENGSIDKTKIEVNSYCEFVTNLEHLCVGLQSPSYTSRFRKKIVDTMSVRFLQLRRGNYVLVLDNEMLTFLIALFTKSKKTKLENMYKAFNSYGIFFNRGSRISIEEYLLKLNLLDRKSDSGEAQYVTVVL